MFTSVLEITNVNDLVFNDVIRYNYLTFPLNLHHYLCVLLDDDALLYII